MKSVNGKFASEAGFCSPDYETETRFQLLQERETEEILVAYTAVYNAAMKKREAHIPN